MSWQYGMSAKLEKGNNKQKYVWCFYVITKGNTIPARSLPLSGLEREILFSCFYSGKVYARKADRVVMRELSGYIPEHVIHYGSLTLPYVFVLQGHTIHHIRNMRYQYTDFPFTRNITKITIENGKPVLVTTISIDE